MPEVARRSALNTSMTQLGLRTKQGIKRDTGALPDDIKTSKAECYVIMEELVPGEILEKPRPSQEGDVFNHAMHESCSDETDRNRFSSPES